MLKHKNSLQREPMPCRPMPLLVQLRGTLPPCTARLPAKGPRARRGKAGDNNNNSNNITTTTTTTTTTNHHNNHHHHDNDNNNDHDHNDNNHSDNNTRGAGPAGAGPGPSRGVGPAAPPLRGTATLRTWTSEGLTQAESSS